MNGEERRKRSEMKAKQRTGGNKKRGNETK